MTQFLLSFFLILALGDELAVGPGGVVAPQNADVLGNKICRDLWAMTCAGPDIPDPTGVSNETNLVNPGETRWTYSELIEFIEGTPTFIKISSNLEALLLRLDQRERGVLLQALPDARNFCPEGLNSVVRLGSCRSALSQGFAKNLFAAHGKDILAMTQIAKFGHARVEDQGLVKVAEGFFNNPEAFGLLFKHRDAVFPHMEALYVDLERKLRVPVRQRYKAELELRRNKAEEVFERVKELMAQKIEARPCLGSNVQECLEQNRFFAAKVRDVELGKRSINCYRIGGPMVSLPDLEYDYEENKVSICKGFLEYTNSEFALADVFGHEIAHAIDPCHCQLPHKGANSPLVMSSKGRANPKQLEVLQQRYIFPDLISCLRRKTSVEVKTWETEEETSFDGQVLAFCEYSGFWGDQAQESAADWLSAETFGDYSSQFLSGLNANEFRAGMRNMKRHYCSYLKDSLALTSNYVGMDKRANRILLVHPVLRERMGCVGKIAPRKVEYCPAGY